MRTALPCLLAIGCSFSPGTTAAIDAPFESDGPVDGPGGCRTFSSQLDTCALPQASAAIAVSGDATYDTSTGILTDNGASSVPQHLTVVGPAGMIEVVIVGAFSLAAGAKLRATGPRAFGIVSPGAITIDGTLDLTGAAAGARTDAACGSAVGQSGVNDNSGGGGGGGGALQGGGGDGGPGDKDNGNSAGGPGGLQIALPAGPLGGCDGGAGGDGNGSQGGIGGDGGGALLIASGMSITVSASGVINLGGSGGIRGGQANDGAGGGGSGGMMLLESRIVVVHGVLAANGGSGGEGGAGLTGITGLPSAMPALGGSGADASGGNGANGGALDASSGSTATDLQNGGGGGGGGGVGFIAIRCPVPVTSGATISPAFTPWP